jgi:hypothetical protein
LHCAIEIPLDIAGDRQQDEEEQYISSARVDTGRKSEEDDEFHKRSSALIKNMDQRVNMFQDRNKQSKIPRGELQSYLMVKLSGWNAQTRVIKNPLGVLSLSGLKLINGLDINKTKGLKI